MGEDEIVIIGVENFWEAEDYVRTLPGVGQITVGYAGGTSDSPGYHTKHDHSEALRIAFNPRKLTLEDLLMRVLEWAGKTQQKVTIFYIDDIQQAEVNRCLQISNARHDSIAADAVPATQFHSAEGYHQGYLAHLRGEFAN